MRPAHLAIAEFKRAPAPSHEILQSKVPMVDHLSTHWNQTQLAGNQAFPIDLTRGRAPAVLSMTATFLSTLCIYIYLRHACRSVPERRHVFRACLLQLQMPNPKTNQQDLDGTSPCENVSTKKLSLGRAFLKQTSLHHCHR